MTFFLSSFPGHARDADSQRLAIASGRATEIRHPSTVRGHAKFTSESGTHLRIPAPDVMNRIGRHAPHRQRHTIELGPRLLDALKPRPQPVFTGRAPAFRGENTNIALNVEYECGEPKLCDIARLRCQIIHRHGEHLRPPVQCQSRYPNLRADRAFFLGEQRDGASRRIDQVTRKSSREIDYRFPRGARERTLVIRRLEPDTCRQVRMGTGLRSGQRRRRRTGRNTKGRFLGADHRRCLHRRIGSSTARHPNDVIYRRCSH